MKTFVLGVLVTCVAFAIMAAAPAQTDSSPDTEGPLMELGAFSVSLAVKDLQVSKAFYSKLGFQPIGGVEEQNWLVLQYGTTTIGLFQGMFEDDILTFNPGWTAKDRNLKEFEDIRDIHSRLKAEGLEFSTELGLDGDGPASFVLSDPDGNPILFDQHVPKPGPKHLR